MPSASATDCATNTVSYTASNPYSLPAHLIESNSVTPGAGQDLVLPAHHSMVISTVTLAQPTTHAQVSFTVRDTTDTVLTDEITFPARHPAGRPNHPWPQPERHPRNSQRFAAAAIAIGAIHLDSAPPRRDHRPQNEDHDSRQVDLRTQLLRALGSCRLARPGSRGRSWLQKDRLP